MNDEFLDHVRTGRCAYIRGDTLGFVQHGARVRIRPRGSRPGETRPAEGSSTFAEEYPVQEITGDVVVLATGFASPTINFLPPDLFPPGYERPHLYLQNFATEDWSVLLTNSAHPATIGASSSYVSPPPSN